WLLNLFGKKDKAKGKAGKGDHTAASNGRAPAPVFEMPSEAADEAAPAEQAESEAILPEQAASEEPSFEAEDDFAFAAVDEAEATTGVYHDESAAADGACDDEDVAAFAFAGGGEEEPARTAEAAAEETPAGAEEESPKEEAAAQ